MQVEKDLREKERQKRAQAFLERELRAKERAEQASSKSFVVKLRSTTASSTAEQAFLERKERAEQASSKAFFFL